MEHSDRKIKTKNTAENLCFAFEFVAKQEEDAKKNVVQIYTLAGRPYPFEGLGYCPIMFQLRNLHRPQS